MNSSVNPSLLKKAPLFHAMNEAEIEHLLRCLQAHQASYQKGETIFHAGHPISEIGLVLCGSVNMVVNLYWGSSRIFGHIASGEIFGENYAAIEGQALAGDIVAAQDCRILFLDFKRIYTVCRHSCPFHHQLIENLLILSARKNLMLSQRMLHTSPRTIRDRLLSYLSWQAQQHGKNEFSIPFNRQELADYLGVDRTALSAQLSRMRQEGLLDYRKNHFILMKDGDEIFAAFPMG